MKKPIYISYIVFLLISMGASAHGATGGYLITSESLTLNGADYEIYCLGSFSGTSLSINDNMQIVGDGTDKSFVYNVNFYSGGEIETVDVVTSFTKLTDINDSGQVAGYGYASGVKTSVIYGDSAYQTIESIGGGASYVRALNNSGTAVGSYKTGGGKTHAFMYDGISMTDLSTLGGDTCVATDINDLGDITGYSTTDAGVRKAFIYSNGNMTAIETLGGASSAGNAINSAGHVVGSSETGDGETHAYFWDGESIDLGTLGGEESVAYGMNDSDEVVGSSETGTDGEYHAFYYCGDALVDLSGFLPGDSVWDCLVAAYDVNDLGQIVGVGVIDGETYAFLLSPAALSQVPVPGACLLLGSCVLAAGALKKKKFKV